MGGKQAFVVGGGNSAGQAALHLSKYADYVAIVIRSQSLAAGMSDYLIPDIPTVPNIDVRDDTEIASGGGQGHPAHLPLPAQRGGPRPAGPPDALAGLRGTTRTTERPPTLGSRHHPGFF